MIVRGHSALTATPCGPNSAARPSVTKLKPKSYQAFRPDRLDLCVWADIKNKYAEHWLIKNDSQEVHNFHLHQAKFEVLSHEDGPKPKVPSRASGPGNLHDNYPINPGGWVLLKVAFDRPEQAGIYMYHCHILEHEDKGMMSMIQVVDTSLGAAGGRSLDPSQQALARYLAEAPPWMRGAVCHVPRRN